MDNGVLEKCFISPYLRARGGGPVNIVDVLDDIPAAIEGVADSIFPGRTGDGKDASGGTVNSLTESVMGITAGLFEVASAIRYLADSK